MRNKTTYENPMECDNNLYVGTDAPESVYLWIGDDKGLSYYMPPDQVSGLIQQLQSWLDEREHEADAAQEWYEEQLDKAATHCARCGGKLSALSWSCGVLADLCPDCEAGERGLIVHHPEEFFIDDSYTCKICGYNTDSEGDFVEHILDAHEMLARKSNAVSISGEDRDEYWDVDSIALAEEFDAS